MASFDRKRIGWEWRHATWQGWAVTIVGAIVLSVIARALLGGA